MSGGDWLGSLETEFDCYVISHDITRIYQEIEQIMAVDYGKAISSVSGTINSIKTLTDLAIKSHAVDLKEGLLNLREEMLELKTALIDAKEENFELKQENTRLEEQILELQGQRLSKMECINGLFYEPGKPEAFCPNCHNDGKRTMLSISGAGRIRAFNCPVCNWSKSVV